MFTDAIAQIRWFLSNIVEQFGTHGLLNSAAALTYTTLFAVVPLMTVTYAILSLFPESSTFAQQIQAFIFENFMPSSSSAIVQEKLNDFAQQARELTFVGFALLFATAFMTLVSVERAFNEIWQVAEPRRGLQRFLVYWGVLTCGPPLVLAGLLVSSYLISLPLVTHSDSAAQQSLWRALPILFSTIGFTVLFYAVPNCRVRLRDALAGGFVTMIFFEGAKRLFTLIVATANMQLIYGTFAAVPLFLTWLFLVWILILSGAIVVRTLGLERESAPHDDAPMLVQCIRVLAFLRRAHREGRSVRRADLNDAVKMSGTERDAVLGVLGEFNLLAEAAKDEVLLGRDLRGITVLDLYRRLPCGVEPQVLARVQDLPRLVALLNEYARQGEELLAVDVDRVVDDAPEPLWEPS